MSELYLFKDWISYNVVEHSNHHNLLDAGSRRFSVEWITDEIDGIFTMLFKYLSIIIIDLFSIENYFYFKLVLFLHFLFFSLS